MQSPPARFAKRFVRNQIRRVTSIDPLALLPPPRRAPGARTVVGLVGFYGFGNYGDELFREVYREHLGDAFELRSILDPARRSIGQRLGSGVRESDAIVIGGGDIVIPWSSASRYWERSYLRRPVFVAGVGVPTWREPIPYSVRRLELFFGSPSVRFIGTRDPESSGWIEENLRPRVPVATAPDLVCGLTLPSAVRPPGQPIFGVAVRSRSEPDDLSHVRALCERAMSLGYRVRRIVLATGNVRRRDLEATDGLGLPDTELISSDDLDVISRSIGECTAMASMKFHGVVVATMYGVPAIATMPTTKTRNFMRRIERQDLLSAYSSRDLPAFLTPDIAPIAHETRERLRADAVAHLADLRASIEQALATA
jgi:hypothetical protein